MINNSRFRNCFFLSVHRTVGLWIAKQKEFEEAIAITKQVLLTGARHPNLIAISINLFGIKKMHRRRREVVCIGGCCFASFLGLVKVICLTRYHLICIRNGPHDGDC